MSKRTWTCEKLDCGYMVTKKVGEWGREYEEAERLAVGVVENLIAWLGITKYQLVKEEEPASLAERGTAGRQK